MLDGLLVAGGSINFRIPPFCYVWIPPFYLILIPFFSYQDYFLFDNTFSTGSRCVLDVVVKSSVSPIGNAVRMYEFFNVHNKPLIFCSLASLLLHITQRLDRYFLISKVLLKPSRSKLICMYIIW